MKRTCAVKRVGLVMVGVLVAGGACTHTPELYCEDSADCTDPERPYCDLYGDYPASEGHGKTCIPDPFADVDAGVADAGVIDGAPADAGIASLTVAVVGNGSVISDPIGINCGGGNSDCAAAFEFATSITLTATPAVDSSFSGWTEAPAGCESGGCTFVINGDESLNANFALKEYLLTVTTGGDGSGGVTSTSPAGGIDCGSDCTEAYDHGTVVELSAAATGDSAFGGWSGACSGLNPTDCSITMDAAKSVGAAFDLDLFSLSVSLTGTGAGAVTSSPGAIDCPGSCADSYNGGTLVTLTATPDGTSTFAAWTNCTPTGTFTCQTTVNAATSVTAEFTRITYSLAVTKSGGGDGQIWSSSPVGINCAPGCASQSADFDADTVVTLNAVADGNSAFAGWSGGGCSGTGPCAVTMDAAKSVTATFLSTNANLADLTVSAPGGLAPAFNDITTDYAMNASSLIQEAQITATAADEGATITVDGAAVASGAAADIASLWDGVPTTIVVTAEAGNTKTHTVADGVVGDVAQGAYVKASNTNAGDEFGFSVSVSGDTMVIGAPKEDSSTTGTSSSGNNSADDAGAVYVYRRSGASWTQEAYIKASNTDAGDQFGYDVALFGDTLVVSAVGEDSIGTGVNPAAQTDNHAEGAGAVYVFRRSGAIWSQEAYLKASNTNPGDQFGYSVAIYGDTIAVGARDEDGAGTGVNPTTQSDNSATDSGAVYLFKRSGETWSQTAYIKACNTGAGDWFGYDVAVSEDWLAVGARGEDSNAVGSGNSCGLAGDQADDDSAEDSGAAYLYKLPDWSEQYYVKASNTGAGDLFGVSVALSSELLIVGALYEDSSAIGFNPGPVGEADNGANNAGAAYVFYYNGALAWPQATYLKASNTDAGDTFGSAVAIYGNKVVVSARNENSSATGVDPAAPAQDDDSAGNAGAVYIYLAVDDGGSSLTPIYVKASNSDADDRFGLSVALSQDTLVVGAFNEDSVATGVNPAGQSDNSAANAGAAYVFH